LPTPLRVLRTIISVGVCATRGLTILSAAWPQLGELRRRVVRSDIAVGMSDETDERLSRFVGVEGLLGLGILPWIGKWTDSFFVNGNVTWSDSEIDVGQQAQGLTNRTRRLTQHSEYVVNVQLGYDSLDAKHSASLAYNVFGERIFFAGRNGAADAFEQPFQSLDLVYSYYPTDRLQITAKVKNLLDEDLQLKRGDVTVLEQEIGLLGTLEVSWQL
jgi:outer membrane receptor for ferrienterochelin and colicin